MEVRRMSLARCCSSSTPTTSPAKPSSSMAAGMSDAEARVAQRFARIIVVGGGCYGGYYVRQLARAVHAGAIVAESIVVVDRDPSCAVAPTLVDLAVAP